MKMTRFSHCQWGLILAISTSMSLTGCRSGGFWKMPGSSMFASSRQPDADKLAGRSEATEGDIPQLPVSPAAKYSPDSMASVGNRSTSPSSSTAVQPTNNAYGFQAQTVATPTTGLAAKSNGYQTGPYQVGAAGSSSSANAGVPGAASGSSYPSPYGGTYTANTGTDVKLPNSVQGAMSTAANTMPSYPSVNGTSTPTYNGTGGYGPRASTGQVPAGNPALPPATPSASYSPTATYGNPASYGLPAQPSSPVNSATLGGQNAPSGYPGNSAGLPAYPAIPQASAGSVGQPPASSAYQGATTLSGYTPGTTARSTTYDFSPKTDAASGNSSSGAALPPNTATLPSYPSYPNSSLVR